MRKFTLDCAVLTDKKLLLEQMAKIFEGMYALNYDAFIDAATFCDEKTLLQFLHFEEFETPCDLQEVLEIIHNENHAVNFEIS